MCTWHPDGNVEDVGWVPHVLLVGGRGRVVEVVKVKGGAPLVQEVESGREGVPVVDLSVMFWIRYLSI